MIGGNYIDLLCVCVCHEDYATTQCTNCSCGHLSISSSSKMLEIKLNDKILKIEERLRKIEQLLSEITAILNI